MRRGGVNYASRVVDPSTLRKYIMLVTYIILGFTAIAGIAIAKDDMSAL